MQTSSRVRPSTPGNGSRTLTITRDPADENKSSDDERQNESTSSSRVLGSLKLRGASSKPKQRVAWEEDVVDNEGCGKKKSKICCIYHKPRRFDESSDESDSDSDSSPHEHDLHYHPRPRTPEQTLKIQESPVQPEPNAYEQHPDKSQKGKRKAE